MVTRLLLSLKKAGASQESAWSLGELTTTTVGFAEHRGGATTNDEIILNTFASTDNGTQSRAIKDGERSRTGAYTYERRSVPSLA